MFQFDKDFDPKAVTYNVKNAYACALAARLAYSDPTAIDKETKTWGFNHFEFFEDGKTDTQAFITANEQMVLVSFRGTESKKDVLSDGNIAHVPGPNGTVHAGFWRALSSVWPQVDAAVDTLRAKKVNGKRPSIWFTGHSLGAALATLAVAQRVIEGKKPVHGLYTFGSPRCGNKDLKTSFENFFGAAYRFVNNNDLVTRIPPRIFNYRHVGNLRYITSEGNIEKSPSFWGKFLDRMEGRWEDIKEIEDGDVLLDGLEDHKMEGYISQIKKNL